MNRSSLSDAPSSPVPNARSSPTPIRCARRGRQKTRSASCRRYSSAIASSFPAAVAGGSPSAIRARILTISASAQYATPSP